MTNLAQLEQTVDPQDDDLISTEGDEEKSEIDDKYEDNSENITAFFQFMKNIPTPVEVSQDAETSAINDKGEWLRWYYRLGHLSYAKMKILMVLGILPKRLLRAT